MKTCTLCGQSKDLTCFKKWKAQCKTCIRKREKERGYRGSRGNPEARKNIIREHLLTHSCVDCGESDPRVLQFDHITPSEKKGNVGKQNTVAALLREIAKCEIRCANCHMRRTALQFGWRKGL